MFACVHALQYISYVLPSGKAGCFPFPLSIGCKLRASWHYSGRPLNKHVLRYHTKAQARHCRENATPFTALTTSASPTSLCPFPSLYFPFVCFYFLLFTYLFYKDCILQGSSPLPPPTSPPLPPPQLPLPVRLPLPPSASKPLPSAPLKPSSPAPPPPTLS